MSKISIIIPVYKVEEYLPECLLGLIAQTYHNWEAICVDDGSPDNCGKILDDFALKDARIKVIHQANQGTAVARQTAIDNATGQYFAFLDSDDVYAPTFLEEMYNTIKEHNVDIVYCDRLKGAVLTEWEQLNSKQKVSIYDNVFEKFIQKSPNFSMCLWNKVYKRELFENLSEVPALPVGQDLCLLYQLMYNAKNIAHVSQKLYFYRIRENSSIRTKFSQRNIDGVIGLQTFLYNTFNKKQLNEKIWKYMQISIAKAILKICIIDPYKRDKSNYKEWYKKTLPLLKKLEEDKIYSPQHLPLKYKIKKWWYLLGVK